MLWVSFDFHDESLYHTLVRWGSNFSEAFSCFPCFSGWTDADSFASLPRGKDALATIKVPALTLFQSTQFSSIIDQANVRR